MPTNVLKVWHFLAQFCFIKLLVNGWNASTWRQRDIISVYCTKFFNGFRSSVFLLFPLSALIVPLIALNVFPFSTLQLPQSLYLLKLWYGPALCDIQRAWSKTRSTEMTPLWEKMRHCKIFLTRKAIWRSQSFNHHSRSCLEKNFT